MIVLKPFIIDHTGWLEATWVDFKQEPDKVIPGKDAVVNDDGVIIEQAIPETIEPGEITEKQVNCVSYHPTQVVLLMHDIEQWAAPLSVENAQLIEEWTSSYTPPDPKPLAERVSAKWEEIKKERDHRKTLGVKAGGHWFHSDTDSRVQWIGLKDTARDLLLEDAPVTTVIQLLGQPVVWKTLKGDFVPVTIELALNVVQATKELDSIVFKVAETHRLTMEASGDPETYDYSTGWPEKISDEEQT